MAALNRLLRILVRNVGANSLCRAPKRRTMHKLESQSKIPV